MKEIAIIYGPIQNCHCNHIWSSLLCRLQSYLVPSIKIIAITSGPPPYFGVATVGDQTVIRNFFYLGRVYQQRWAYKNHKSSLRIRRIQFFTTVYQTATQFENKIFYLFEILFY